MVSKNNKIIFLANFLHGGGQFLEKGPATKAQIATSRLKLKYLEIGKNSETSYKLSTVNP